MPSLWEVLKTSKGLPAPDGFTALFARSLSDTYTLAEISGIPPLSLGEIVEIVDYTIYGNTYQSENVSPDTPQEVVGCGDFDESTGKYKISVVTSLTKIQLELGTEATSYDPYLPPITTPIYLDSPLYKIGDYADVRGKTEEVRAVKELVLTGEEDWKKSNTYKGSFYARVLTDLRSPYDVAYCSHAVQVKTLAEYMYGKFLIENAADSPILNLFIGQPEWTVDDFKAFLAAQYAAGTPVKVYYVLATPEITEVNSVEIPTLNGTTVIDVDTEVKPSNLKITYKSKM